MRKRRSFGCNVKSCGSGALQPRDGRGWLCAMDRRGKTWSAVPLRCTHRQAWALRVVCCYCAVKRLYYRTFTCAERGRSDGEWEEEPTGRGCRTYTHGNRENHQSCKAILCTTQTASPGSHRTRRQSVIGVCSRNAGRGTRGTQGPPFAKAFEAYMCVRSCAHA
jgi:hypothetical protein